MPLTEEQMNVIMNQMAAACGLPITHKDPLQAFEGGLRSALGFIAPMVTLDPQADPVQEVLEGAQKNAARSVQSEQPAGNGSGVN